MAEHGSLVELLEWDSDFFGFPIGRASLDTVDEAALRAIDEQARSLGIRCLYGTLDPDDAHASYLLQSFGHRLVEVGISYVRPPGPWGDDHGAPVARVASLDEVGGLDDAVHTLGPWSRFGADPRFGADAARRMYRAWLERAARDDDRDLLVTEDEQGLTGLATVKRGSPPMMDLVGVTRPGTGAARALFAKFHEWGGGGEVEAGYAAARNVAIQRLLAKIGFSPTTVRYTFHRWLDEAPVR